MEFSATFQAKPGTHPQKVFTEAMNSSLAKDKLEAMYGRGTITNIQWTGK